MSIGDGDEGESAILPLPPFILDEGIVKKYPSFTGFKNVNPAPQSPLEPKVGIISGCGYDIPCKNLVGGIALCLSDYKQWMFAHDSGEILFLMWHYSTGLETLPPWTS